MTNEEFEKIYKIKTGAKWFYGCGRWGQSQRGTNDLELIAKKVFYSRKANKRTGGPGRIAHFDQLDIDIRHDVLFLNGAKPAPFYTWLHVGEWDIYMESCHADFPGTISVMRHKEEKADATLA